MPHYHCCFVFLFIFDVFSFSYIFTFVSIIAHFKSSVYNIFLSGYFTNRLLAGFAGVTRQSPTSVMSKLTISIVKHDHLDLRVFVGKSPICLLEIGYFFKSLDS